MEIKILGTGCSKCKKLEELTKQTADEMGLKYNIEKVTDIQKIMEYSVMSSPSLVVNGVVKVTGRVPSAEEIKKMLS